MFTRHEFTCPDVIYLRNRQRKIGIAYTGAMLVLYGGLWAYATFKGKSLEEALDNDIQS